GPTAPAAGCRRPPRSRRPPRAAAPRRSAANGIEARRSGGSWRARISGASSHPPRRHPRIWDDLRVTTSANVTWHAGVVERTQRWESIGQRGATVWFTGLPASGKSTVSSAVEAELVRAGRAAYRLDGDNLRHGVCGDLGFTAEDRDRNVRRTAEVARLFADAGVVALVSVVSPYAAARAFARELHERDGLRFIEVFV